MVEFGSMMPWWFPLTILGVVGGVVVLWILFAPIRAVFDALNLNDKQRETVVGLILLGCLFWWANTSNQSRLPEPTSAEPISIQETSDTLLYLPVISK